MDLISIKFVVFPYRKKLFEEALERNEYYSFFVRDENRKLHESSTSFMIPGNIWTETFHEEMVTWLSAFALPPVIKRIPETKWQKGLRKPFPEFHINSELTVRAVLEEPEGYRPSKDTLAICPGMGFGTGDHESTRLILRWMDEVLSAPPVYDTMLDAGCGSGILSIFARLKGVNHVIALDNDPEALENARKNISINRTGGITLMRTDCNRLPFRSSFPLVAVNMTMARQERFITANTNFLKETRALICSGLIVEQKNEFLSCLPENTWEITGEKKEGNWLAFYLKRKGISAE